MDDRDQCPKQEKRLQYCRGKLTWKVDEHWKNVILSDEMTIAIKPDGKIKKLKFGGKGGVII